MTPTEFVECIAREKDELLAMAMDLNSGSAAAEHIAALDLNSDQINHLKNAIDGLLTDAYYSFLLGLDGAGSLGGQQRDYELKDEDGSLLTKGELEGPAWERFHGDAID